jgi:hypothetical protein
LISCFSAFDASPSFADAVLRCVRHRLNTRAGVRHCGDYFAGHYEQYYVEGIQQATLDIFGFPFHPSWKSSEDWINSNEKFGLVQGKYPEFVVESIPSSIELKSKEQKYLCDQLKIKAPFLPVHTKAEQKLFTQCMTQNLNVTDILEQFARKCDGINIFPKMHSHIEKHLKSWKEYGKNMQLLQKSRPDICLLRESMILENSRENYTLEENDSSDEVNDDDVDYTSVDENDQIDERDTANQYTEDGDILDDSIPEDSNLAMDPGDTSINTTNRNEPGPHLDLHEDISGTNSQIDLSESADVLQNLTPESAPQSQNLLPSSEPITHHAIINFLPSFNLNSTVPVDLQRVQAQQREIPEEKNRAKRRCMNRHPEDPGLVCGRDSCPGSGGRSRCENRDYSTYVVAKRRRAMSSDTNADT